MSTWPRIVRVAIGVVGAAMVVGAAILSRTVGPPALWVAVMGGVLIAAAIFEVGRYRAGASGDDLERFQRTDEVFVDPTTGVKTRVWFDPRSGERRYEPEA
jgi:hypothetical protein